MSAALLDLITDVLKDLQSKSWHENVRRDLGLSDETDGEALLALTIERPDRPAKPIAFVMDGTQIHNTLLALTEFLRESFHPITGAASALAIIDYLPPLDSEGKSRGPGRRWVLDRTNQMLVLPELTRFIRTLSRAL